MNFRKATYEDLPRVFQLCLEFCEHAKICYQPEYMFCTLQNIVTSSNAAAWVAEVDGKFVGIFAGFIDRDCYSGELYAMDRFVYSIPAYRNADVAYSLYKLFMSWAKGLGASRALLSILCSDNNERLEQTVRWLGYDRRGYLLEKVL